MIKIFKHKGLERFFKTGSKSGITPAHERRLKIILQHLNAAVEPEDLNTPSMRFHSLIGEFKGFYSVSVSGNWRVIFKFSDGHAEDVNYLDYH